jgi:hypothetical protein
MEVVKMVEEYDSLVRDPYSHSKSYPIFKNPSKSEISELSKDTNSARFISHDKNLYVFNAQILHDHAAKHLDLPINQNSPDIKRTFQGIAKPNHDGSLAFSETNQKIRNATDIEKYHGHLKTYFK